jgi:hypothetical protein
MNPDANNTRDIGAPGFSWNDLRLFNLKDTNDTSAFAVFDRQLFDSGGDTVLEFSANTTGISVGLGSGGVVVPLNFSDADASFFAGIKSPDVLAASYTLTLPPDDGDASEVLTTDGSGILTWEPAASTTFPLLASPTGTAAAPAYSFSGDSDVGMYSDELNTVSFSTGSALKWKIQNTGDWTPGTTNAFAIGSTSLTPSEIFSRGLTLTVATGAKFFDSDNSNFALINPPTVIASDYTLTLPPDDGDANEVLATDGSGILTWTTPPEARAHNSATAISGTLATIDWTTEDYDTDSALVSGVFTCPRSGKYQVNASLALSGTFLLNNTTIMEIQKNGTAWANNTHYIAAAITNEQIDVSDVVDCAATDTIRIQVSNSGTTPAVVSSDTKNFFSISYLGN